MSREMVSSHVETGVGIPEVQQTQQLQEVVNLRSLKVPAHLVLQRQPHVIDPTTNHLIQQLKPNTLSKVKRANPYGYILKPFNETELCTALELAQAHHQKERELKAENEMLKSFSSFKPGADHLFVKSNSRFTRLPNDDVYYVEALKDYMQIVTRNKTYVIHATMKETERKMSSPDFQRVHRSFIVNMNHIEYIAAGEITMKDLGVKIPVGGLYKEKFAARINVL